MIPDFALSLTSDGLTLLRREAGGWLALADADLSADGFDAMRERAQALDPAGAQVALFLPNDQVRYLEMPDPGTEADRRAALEAALDGVTPYRVADLVLDWSLSGTTLLGAAVARESLEEAEAYLRERGFEPVLFAAIPPSGTFRGTAYFGPADGWHGDAPERPGKVVLLPLEVTAEAQTAEPEPVADPQTLPDTPAVVPQAPAPAATPAPPAPVEAPVETPRADPPADRASQMPPAEPPAPPTVADPEPFSAPVPSVPPIPEAAPPVPPVAPPVSHPAPASGAPSFSSVRASR
ncbi:hypothetical protein CLG85_026375, partial [Yangia mangrovi]|nr:hypothetical protein [Alloyangia mangrovi]